MFWCQVDLGYSFNLLRASAHAWIPSLCWIQVYSDFTSTVAKVVFGSTVRSFKSLSGVFERRGEGFHHRLKPIV